MAGRGPASKGTSSRPRDQRRRNDVGKVEVSADGELRGPDLPELGPDPITHTAREWPEATLLWWKTWRESAQASTFTDTDWSFLIDTAILHMRYWQGNAQVGAELRLRVAKFGATPEDRARLKMAITPPAPAAPAAAATPAAKKATTSRKKRVLELIEGGKDGGDAQVS